MIEKKIIEKIIIDLRTKSVKIDMKDEALFFSKYEYKELLSGYEVSDDEISYRMKKEEPEKIYLLIEEAF